MKQLILASLIATLAACPSAPRPILTDQPQLRTAYRFAAVESNSDSAKQLDAHREQIVTRYASGKRTAYVVGERTPTEVPLQSLDKATLIVEVSRVSDINGWGVEVNGEVHRATTLKLEFPKAQLAKAFTMLQQIQTAPFETLGSVWPTSLGEIRSAKPVAWFERGYVVDVNARLVTGNPFDAETQVTLYRAYKRSPYVAL